MFTEGLEKDDPSLFGSQPCADDFSLLAQSIERNAVRCVELLLKRNPSLVTATNHRKWTPLHLSCCFYPFEQQEKRLQIVRMLCEAGVPIEARCREKYMAATALEILCRACYHKELVMPVALVLIDYGAYVDSSPASQLYAAYVARQEAIKKRRQAMVVGLWCLRKRGVPKDLRLMLMPNSRFAWRAWLEKAKNEEPF